MAGLPVFAFFMPKSYSSFKNLINGNRELFSIGDGAELCLYLVGLVKRFREIFPKFLQAVQAVAGAIPMRDFCCKLPECGRVNGW